MAHCGDFKANGDYLYGQGGAVGRLESELGRICEELGEGGLVLVGIMVWDWSFYGTRWLESICSYR